MTRFVLGLEMITGQGWTGGAIYIRNLVATLATLPENDRPEIRLLGVGDCDEPNVRDLRSFPFVDSDLRFRRRPNQFRRTWRRVARRLGLNFAARDPLYAGIDATYPTFGAPIANAVPVHWMPDFQHKHLPHMFTPEELAARDAGLEGLAKKDITLVLSSSAAKADFERFYPGARARPYVWRFVSLPSSGDDRDPRQVHGLPERYLYLPNQFWAHKNHLTAFKAMTRLIAAGHDLVLVCTGLEEDHRDAGHSAKLRAYLAENGLQERVRLLGLLPRQEQIAIFRHATLVMQPSLFEGWSTVVEDAKALGRPLIVSDIAVHREQLNEQTSVAPFEFFQPMDEVALAEAIARMWPTLAAGPDRDAERRAARLNAERQRVAGSEFMAIMRAAVSRYRSRE